MLTTGVTTQVTIPFEPGQYVNIKMLSGADLRRARESRASKALEKAKAMGSELITSLRAAAPTLTTQTPEMTVTLTAVPDAVDMEPNPADTYDLDLVLRAGILGWSYPAEVTPFTIDSQDERWQEYVFREIVKFSKPPTEDDLGNSSGRST